MNHIPEIVFGRLTFLGYKLYIAAYASPKTCEVIFLVKNKTNFKYLCNEYSS